NGLMPAAPRGEQITWLVDELKFEFKEGSELLNVAMTGENPEELQVLVDAVTQSYLTEVVSQETKQRSDRLAELENIYTGKKESVRTKRETLRRRAEDLGTSDSQALSVKQVMLMTTLGDLRRQRGAVRWEVMKAQAKRGSKNTRTRGAPAPAEIETAVNEAVLEDAKVKGLTNRISTLQRIVGEYEATARFKTESALVHARAQLDKTKADLEARKAELRTDLAERLRQKAKNDYEGTLAQLQDDANALAEQEKTLLAQLQDAEKDAGKIGNSSTVLEMDRQELKQEETVLDQIGHEYETLRVELRSPPR